MPKCGYFEVELQEFYNQMQEFCHQTADTLRASM
jgi:hypothetical protein